MDYRKILLIVFISIITISCLFSCEEKEEKEWVGTYKVDVTNFAKQIAEINGIDYEKLDEEKKKEIHEQTDGMIKMILKENNTFIIYEPEEIKIGTIIDKGENVLELKTDKATRLISIKDGKFSMDILGFNVNFVKAKEEVRKNED